MALIRILNLDVEDNTSAMRGIWSRGEMEEWECEEINDEIREVLEARIPFVIDIDEAILNNKDKDYREYAICEEIKKCLKDDEGNDMWTDFCEFVDLEYEVID